MGIDLDALLEKARKFHESIEPVEVEVVVGDRAIVVRVPYMMPAEFVELTDRYAPKPGGAVDGWWDGNGLARNFPGLVLVDGEDEDDMFVLRDREAFYRWPEVWDELSSEDRESVRSAIWGLHVYESQKRRTAALERHVAEVKSAKGGA